MGCIRTWVEEIERRTTNVDVVAEHPAVAAAFTGFGHFDARPANPR